MRSCVCAVAVACWGVPAVDADERAIYIVSISISLRCYSYANSEHLVPRLCPVENTAAMLYHRRLLYVASPHLWYKCGMYKTPQTGHVFGRTGLSVALRIRCPAIIV